MVATADQERDMYLSVVLSIKQKLTTSSVTLGAGVSFLCYVSSYYSTRLRIESLQVLGSLPVREPRY